jgi:hypothetical protein
MYSVHQAQEAQLEKMYNNFQLSLLRHHNSQGRRFMHELNQCNLNIRTCR